MDVPGRDVVSDWNLCCGDLGDPAVLTGAVRGSENGCGVIRVREAVGGSQIERSCSKVGQSVGRTKCVCMCVCVFSRKHLI